MRPSPTPVERSDLRMVRDAGFTELEPGSPTVIADAPWLRQGVLEV